MMDVSRRLEVIMSYIDDLKDRLEVLTNPQKLKLAAKTFAVGASISFGVITFFYIIDLIRVVMNSDGGNLYGSLIEIAHQWSTAIT